MNNFKPQRSFGGNKPYGAKSFGNKGGFDRGPREMFQANCASCGKTCEVPFRPNGKKPVYCTECFAKNGGPTRNDSFEKKPFNKPFAPKFPANPTPRPQFQSAPQAPRDDQAFKDLKAELRGVNEKLERLISLIDLSMKSAGPKEAKAMKTSKKSAKKAK